MLTTQQTQHVDLKFRNQQEFGEFCLALRDDAVHFALGGFHTVVLSNETFQNLTGRSRQLLEKFKAEGLVDIKPATSAGPRHLPTAEETEQLLRKFTNTR
jgi:hypothetical protein